MISRRFLITLITLVVIALGAAFVVLLAKGYRISPKKGTITGTGIISVTSVPDQASVYIDGHLTTATNDNINYLIPKSYTVKIVKEGYIPWEKKIEVNEGLVTEIKATLFRSIPSVYPLTYSGATNLVVSPDVLKIVYVVPETNEPTATTSKKSGVWIWPMADKALAFGRGTDPRQIGLSDGLDYSKAQFRWSPDSTQVLAIFADRDLLFDINKLNDPPRDITALINSTLKTWDEQQKARDLTKLQSINELSLRKTASEAAVLKWSPDETRILYSKDGKEDYKVSDLTTKKTYSLPKATNYNWLADSDHLVLVELNENQPNFDQQNPNSPNTTVFPNGKISIIESDGFNKSEIYAGNFDPDAVVPWPDGSRLVIISSLPTATASKPNLYGVNLK